MYHYPPNSLEFRKGYAMGISKGRSMERKLCLGLVIGFVFLFEVTHWVMGLFSTCK
jgi:hypothetical protein